VEKGAAAEVLRKGNNPPATDSSPTWRINPTYRKVLTLPLATFGSSTPVAFDTSSSGLSLPLVDFILGKDTERDLGDYLPPPVTGAWAVDTTVTRPSLHGDVIHSRPLPVNYRTTTDTTAGVTVLYGANDGTLRALNATTGKERWAIIAPEFFPDLARLKANTDLIAFPPDFTGTRKRYFWDGSAGLYQNLDNSKVWMFPTMRRGGRMLYAFDITSVDSPTQMWKLGCPNFTDDTGCNSPDGTDVSAIGQTWSTPSVAFIKGYPTLGAEEPVLVMGGGMDACEDDRSSAPPCGSPKGNRIFVINARTGAIVKQFSTVRSVASDVAMVDINNDGFVDYAYVADTGGNFYRVDFVDGAASYANLAVAQWARYKVARTTGTGSPLATAPRKFFFPPALLYNNGRVYVAAGSGDREHPLQSDYPFTDVKNRFYVYLDILSTKPTDAQTIDLDSGSLADQTVQTDASCTPEGTTAAVPAGRGWFMDLNQYGPGEQTVTSALILGGLVTFSTNRPVDPAAGSCSTTLGEARGYWVNLLNGSGGIGVAANHVCGGDRSATFVGGGLPPSPVSGVVPVDGIARTVVIGAVQRDGTASAPIAGQKVVPSIRAIRTRVYWFKNIDN
jgi:type IV pilus assembly protein PilY1